MNILKILIILITIITFLYLTREMYKRRLNKTNVAEYLTIYGIIFGVLVYFDLSPQSVKVEKSKDVKLCSLEAYEKVSRKGAGYSILQSEPDFFFSTYISNVGDIPITDPIFKFRFENEPQNFYPTLLKAYLNNATKNIYNSQESLGLNSDSMDNCRITRSDDGYYQITLPPIFSNESFKLTISYKDNRPDTLKSDLDFLVSGSVEIKIVERGLLIPSWEPDKSKLENYKTIRKKDDDLLASATIKFLLVTFQSGIGF